MASPLKLDDAIEDVAERLGNLYAGVDISRDPMFSWLHITNDATILGEELRRDRKREAADRAGKIFIRLFEFLGYYLYCHPGNKGEFSDLVAATLRLPSYEGFFQKLEEGPTRWILFKYPRSCSKCGKRPCHCMIYAEILENRREKSQEYLQNFEGKVKAAREALDGEGCQPFSIRLLFEHFREIYSNNYYLQDPWKIGMHLSEEIGEATTELSRMNLVWRAQKAEFNIQGVVEEACKISGDRLEKETGQITDDGVQAKRRKEINDELADLAGQLKARPWEEFRRLVGEKFKEEVSDVFSWLAAVILKLDPELKIFENLLGSLSKEGKGGVVELACKYCHESHCENNCLVTHGLSAEIIEKLSKF